MKTLLIALVLISAGMAQNAVVVELSPSDAAEARKVFEAKQAADKAWDELYARIQKAHASTEFEWGVNFSKEFRFMVPAATPMTGSAVVSCGPRFYSSPAVGGVGGMGTNGLPVGQ